MSATLCEILDEIGVREISVTKQRAPMETCAIQTLRRILAEHGDEHLRSVLISIVLVAAIDLSLSEAPERRFAT